MPAIVFREIGIKKNSHVDNIVLGFSYGGSNEENVKFPSITLTNIHTNVNLLQVRVSSNVFKTSDRYFQIHRYFNEIDLDSCMQSIWQIDEVEVSWPVVKSADASGYSIRQTGHKLLMCRDQKKNMVYCMHDDHYNVLGS